MWLSLILLADFSGTWALDRDASESMDVLLAETQDLSWIERKMMGSVDINHVIVQSDDAVVVDVVSDVFTRSSTLHPDGEWRDVTMRSGPGKQRVWWEGEILVTESKGQLADGTAATYTTRRWTEGTTMYLQLTIVSDDGRSWTARRVFKKTE